MDFSAPAVMIIILCVAILAFEISMLIDVIRNDQINSNTRTFWIVGMLLIHPIVAIFYYFTDRKKHL